jgi:hypothetical protein
MRPSKMKRNGWSGSIVHKWRVLAALSSTHANVCEPDPTKHEPSVKPDSLMPYFIRFTLLLLAVLNMASVIKSDFSLSSSLIDGRAGKTTSVVGRLTEGKQVTQLSAIVGNRARDRSLQINGHVTDKINNFNL